MNTVAIDIETTGLAATDQVTVVGIGDEDRYEIHYNADEGRTHFEHDEFEWESNDREIVLYGWPNEERLLTRLSAATNRFGLNHEGRMLVGFNADGFDFPMLRTRKLACSVPWAFRGVNYLDIQGTYKYNYQTTAMDIRGFNKSPLKKFGDHLGIDVKSSWRKHEIHDAIEDHGYDSNEVMEYAGKIGHDTPTKSISTLSGTHKLYVDMDIVDETPHDPLGGDSSLCCKLWSEGDMEPVVKHNLSDLKMTLDLVGLVPEYVHEGELRITRL